MPYNLICRASCQDDDTIPWRNSQWVTGYTVNDFNDAGSGKP